MYHYILISIAILLALAFTLSTVPFKTILDNKNSIWKTKNNKVYLTFDDGPTRKVTPFILDLLKEYNQKATFFLIPEYITKDNEYIIKRIYQEGHAIGLHGKSRWLSFHSIKYLAAYITSFNKRLTRILGESFNIQFFRPPSLWRTPWLYISLNKRNISLVGISPFCWLDQYTKNPSVILKRFKKNLRKGNIYIIHDGIAKYFEPDMDHVKVVLPKLLVYLKKKKINSNTL